MPRRNPDHSEFWAGRHGKPPQPSPYSILKGVRPVAGEHKGFELLAVQQARTGTWFAKAPGYDKDYIGVGPDAKEALARAALYLDEDIPPRGRMNPSYSQHGIRAHAHLLQAKADLKKAGIHHAFYDSTAMGKNRHDLETALNSSLDAIKHAGAAYSDAEGAGMAGLVYAAKKIGDSAIRMAHKVVRSAGAVLNPADIPGGNMTACMAIMEARGDVDSPGALCNWLAQKSGESRGGIRRPKKPLKREQRHLLSRAMRGT